MSIFGKKKQKEQPVDTEQVTISRETEVKITFPASQLISILNDAGYNIPTEEAVVLYSTLPHMGSNSETKVVFVWKRERRCAT